MADHCLRMEVRLQKVRPENVAWARWSRLTPGIPPFRQSLIPVAHVEQMGAPELAKPRETGGAPRLFPRRRQHREEQHREEGEYPHDHEKFCQGEATPGR